MTETRPLILFTNDDGIASPGLWAMVNAFADLGDCLIVAPREQQSGTGRSLPITSEGRIYPQEVAEGAHYVAYAVDGTPAQAVQHGILELSDVLPSLVVSGANFGDNLGNGVTVSGTIGAAIEGASLGIPSLAVSQQTPKDLHLSYSPDVDFSAAAYFARYFGQWLIENHERPDDVDLLKLDVPWGATPETPWKVTRLSRRRVYWPTRPERVSLSDVGRLGYHYDADPSKAEPDSDVYVLLHEKQVSVTPISLDMTSRTDMFRFQQLLTGEKRYGREKRNGRVKAAKQHA
ncbi:MAG: 5'/3'-nucleotidase SurE [bacterium]|nr:5'/3'-nucleotidase SurE [bacterium]